MYISADSSFIKFDLEKAEELAGYDFHAANRAIIQNHIAEFAEDFISLSFRGAGSELTLTLDERLKIEYTRGAIAALKHLLSSADSMREEIQAEALKQQQRDLEQGNI